MANIGYVGLGGLGSQIAAYLMEKGHRVTGYNRTRTKAEPLIALGMQWVDSPRAVSQAADFTIVQVSDSAALRAVADGPDGLLAGLGPGKVLLDMGTNSPAGSRLLAEQVRATGARMVDAPVSGTGTTMRQGRMSIMVGGDPEVFERVKPILLDIGTKVTHVGSNGVAMSMKIAVNLSLAVQFLAFSEAVLLAEKSGIDRATAVDVLLNSVIASPSLQYRGPSVLRDPDQNLFWSVGMMQKDMVLALEMGRALDVPLPTTSATQEYLVAACGLGMSEQDCSVMFKVLARLAGVEA
ncbi:MAG TPA: NAD(P)-dependent oxidoreductase [Rubrivivax sp.]|nr:NAD(P)-dependent oxidoreductase [Rubrivivax sp.]